jgi:hypothetical protein
LMPHISGSTCHLNRRDVLIYCLHFYCLHFLILLCFVSLIAIYINAIKMSRIILCRFYLPPEKGGTAPGHIWKPASLGYDEGGLRSASFKKLF